MIFWRDGICALKYWQIRTILTILVVWDQCFDGVNFLYDTWTFYRKHTSLNILVWPVFCNMRTLVGTFCHPPCRTGSDKIGSYTVSLVTISIGDWSWLSLQYLNFCPHWVGSIIHRHAINILTNTPTFSLRSLNYSLNKIQPRGVAALRFCPSTAGQKWLIENSSNNLDKNPCTLAKCGLWRQNSQLLYRQFQAIMFPMRIEKQYA